RKSEIYLLDEAVVEAEKFLENEEDSMERLEKVKKVIHGFETPYGMELLSTIHWIVNENPEKSRDLSFTIEQIQRWNARKKKIFTAKHIEKVWGYLHRLNITA